MIFGSLVVKPIRVSGENRTRNLLTIQITFQLPNRVNFRDYLLFYSETKQNPRLLATTNYILIPLEC